MGKKKVVNKGDIADLASDGAEAILDIDAEKKALLEEEANQTLPAEASLQETMNMDENTLTAESVEVGAGADESLAAELEAVQTDNATARELNRKVEATESAPEAESKSVAKSEAKATKKRIKTRSKRYQQNAQLIDKNSTYALDEAIELVKKTAKAKFDATIEAHIVLDIKKQKGKATESIRGVIKLPSGAVKVPKVVILDQELADQILKSGKADFDIAIARPADMSKFGRLAKILGPQGKMPNPKVGTVSDKPEEVKQEIESGQIEYRADSFNIVHSGIAKVSWEDDKIKANLQTLLDALKKYKVKKLILASSMGPGVSVKL